MTDTAVRRPDDAREAAEGPLPSGRLVMLAKSAAVQVVTLEMLRAPWPPSVWAHQLLDWTPYLALAALMEAAPECSPWRLAQCLGLDLTIGPRKLAIIRDLEAWPAAGVAHIVAVLAAPVALQVEGIA